MLPRDIAIDKIVPVVDHAHARFDALSRTYVYKLSGRKNPFQFEYVCRMSLRGIDFEKMNEACDVLVEYDDFTSFSKLHTDTKTNRCRLMEAGWKQTEDVWVFTIKADRFLRDMVRAIVGTLLDVGRGKISKDDFRAIIEAKNRCRAGMSAPPQGLALADVNYPEHLLMSCQRTFVVLSS
jgi:tRNA pseudouridine38-40 synthase